MHPARITLLCLAVPSTAYLLWASATFEYNYFTWPRPLPYPDRAAEQVADFLQPNPGFSIDVGVYDIPLYGLTGVAVLFTAALIMPVIASRHAANRAGCCPNCGYDVIPTVLSHRTRCPECDTAFDADTVVASHPRNMMTRQRFAACTLWLALIHWLAVFACWLTWIGSFVSHDSFVIVTLDVLLLPTYWLLEAWPHYGDFVEWPLVFANSVLWGCTATLLLALASRFKSRREVVMKVPETEHTTGSN